jgi:hypothetical protein
VATFLLAQTSDNAAGGALLSLWFLLGLFIIVAAVLWAIYTRPHNRVPPRPPAHAHGASSVAGTGDATPASGSASGPSAGPRASGGTATDDSKAQRPVTPPPPGPDDTGEPQ